jgi:hypothetical protein
VIYGGKKHLDSLIINPYNFNIVNHKEDFMILLVSLLLLGQPGNITTDVRWDSTDVLIEDSLGSNVVFAADYNYTTGEIFAACAIDSGYYGGDSPRYVIFLSQDHGLTWEEIYASWFSGWVVKGVDLVATRNDTIYVSFHYFLKSTGYEHISYYKVYRVYEGSSYWESHYISSELNSTAEYRCPVLVRDDFDPFYLYRAYIIDYDGILDSIRLERSSDKGISWDSIYYSYAVQYFDCDLTVSDSTLYFTYSYDPPPVSDEKAIRTRIYGNRGEGIGLYVDIQTTTDTVNRDIKYPRIGATTTVPDNGQLVYTFYSQRNTVSGSYDLLYRYSQDGGASWLTIPDTLAQGSATPVLCDLRGYEVGPNKYMDMTYCFTYSIPYPSYKNFFRWSSEDDPTNWHDTVYVGEGIESSDPQLIYSPGGSASGGGVVYNDFFGNLWFDAPWYSGIPEDEEKEAKIRSRIILSSSSVEVNSSGSVIYDVMGRKIKGLNGNIWDLTDEKGMKVDSGIYFIVDGETGEREKLILIR